MKNKLLGQADALARAGMISSMGAAVYSGFAGGKLARMVHPWAGLAVVAFSLWHHRIKARQTRAGKKRLQQT